MADKTETPKKILSQEQKKKFNNIIREAQKCEESGDAKQALDLFVKAQDMMPDHEKLTKKISLLAARVKAMQELKKLSNGWYQDKDGFVLDPGAKQPLKLPSSSYEQLFDYQREGIAWLNSLWVKKTGGVLGDDMGLGKTVQVSTYLYGLFKAGRVSKCLLIMPKSLMDNWATELRKWAPKIRVVRYHGTASQRKKALAEIFEDGGIAVTTYGTAVSSLEMLTKDEEGNDITWDVIVLDEGHKIKDPSKKTTKAIYDIQGVSKVVLTGTPIMNNLSEMWALFNYATDGQLLGDKKTFKTYFEDTIIRGNMRAATEVDRILAYQTAEKLRTKISPHFLRREKATVFKQKPVPVLSPASASSPSKASGPGTSPSLRRLEVRAKKNDFIVWIYLSELQKRLYETFLSKEADLIDEVIKKNMSAFSAIHILRKICDHPRLLSKDLQNVESLDLQKTLQEGSVVEQSGKLAFLAELLVNLKNENHRVLIFSQSTKMLDIIQSVITEILGFNFVRIDGSVSDIDERQGIINQFNTNKDIFIFLLTTTVGGVGLNLTSADRVVIFDPAWNTLDDQAADRVYRMGQTKNVIIYRLITCGTIEEKMYRKQVFKGGLSRTLLGQKQQQFSYFTKGELSELFKFDDPDKAETHDMLQGIQSSIQRNKRESLDSHTMFLHGTGQIYGLSDHNLVYDAAPSTPSGDDGGSPSVAALVDKQAREFALNSAKKLDRTVVPKEVIDAERSVDRDELIRQQKEQRAQQQPRVTKKGKVMMVDTAMEDSLIGRLKQMNLEEADSTPAQPVPKLGDRLGDAASQASQSSNPSTPSLRPKPVPRHIPSPIPSPVLFKPISKLAPGTPRSPVARLEPVVFVDVNPAVSEEEEPAESVEAATTTAVSAYAESVAEASEYEAQQEATAAEIEEAQDLEGTSPQIPEAAVSNALVDDEAAEDGNDDEEVEYDDVLDEIGEENADEVNRSGFVDEEADEDGIADEMKDFIVDDDEYDEDDDVEENEEYEDAESGDEAYDQFERIRAYQESHANPNEVSHIVDLTVDQSTYDIDDAEAPEGFSIGADDMYDPQEDGSQHQHAASNVSDEEELEDENGVDIEKLRLIEQLSALSVLEQNPTVEAPVAKETTKPSEVDSKLAAPPAKTPTSSVAPPAQAAPKPKTVEIEAEVEIDVKTPPKKTLNRLKKRKMVIEESDDDEDDDERHDKCRVSDEVEIFDDDVQPEDTKRPSGKHGSMASNSSSNTKVPLKEQARPKRNSPPRPVQSTSTAKSKVPIAVVELSSDEEGSDNDDLSDHSSDNGVSRLSIGSDISELEDEEAQERELALSSSKKVTEIVFKTPDEFKRRREEFSLLAYKDINKRAFGGKLPSIPLRWRKTKAIVGLFVSRVVDGQREFYITLSRNYLTNAQMLLETLAHEMAHAACRIIDKDDDRSHHSPVWWKWARIAMAAYSHKFKISVKCSPEEDWD